MLLAQNFLSPLTPRLTTLAVFYSSAFYFTNVRPVNWLSSLRSWLSSVYFLTFISCGFYKPRFACRLLYCIINSALFVYKCSMPVYYFVVLLMVHLVCIFFIYYRYNSNIHSSFMIDVIDWRMHECLIALSITGYGNLFLQKRYLKLNSISVSSDSSEKAIRLRGISKIFCKCKWNIILAYS